MAGRSKKRKTFTELVEDTAESIAPANDVALVLSGDAELTHSAFDLKYLDEWRRRNGTPLVKITEEQMEIAQRYRDVILYAMDRLAPVLPAVMERLADEALQGTPWAVKEFIRLFQLGTPNVTVDAGTVTNTTNVIMVGEKQQQVVRKLEEMLLSNMVIDGTVVDADDVRSELPPPSDA